MGVGNKIRHLRKLKGLSQDELSSAVSISKTNIARYETNRQQPSIDVVAKLADYFQVSTDFLICEDRPELTTSGLRNATLRQQFEEVAAMDEYYQNLVIDLIDCVITKQKISSIAKKPGS